MIVFGCKGVSMQQSRLLPSAFPAPQVFHFFCPVFLFIYFERLEEIEKQKSL